MKWEQRKIDDFLLRRTYKIGAFAETDLYVKMIPELVLIISFMWQTLSLGKWRRRDMRLKVCTEDFFRLPQIGQVALQFPKNKNFL